jgi:S-DNA-T family DNA segregation ATPase FtsK/SpoIIIE
MDLLESREIVGPVRRVEGPRRPGLREQLPGVLAKLRGSDAEHAAQVSAQASVSTQAASTQAVGHAPATNEPDPATPTIRSLR